MGDFGCDDDVQHARSVWVLANAPHDADAVATARARLHRLAGAQHGPSLEWAARDAWPHDCAAALRFATKAVRVRADAAMCRALGDWLWALARSDVSPAGADDAEEVAALLGCEPTAGEREVRDACRDAAMDAWRTGADAERDVGCMQRIAAAHASRDDEDAALAWWTKAAACGDDGAVRLLARRCLSGAADGEVPVPQLAVFVHKAAERGDAVCRRALGDAAAGLLELDLDVCQDTPADGPEEEPHDQDDGQVLRVERDDALVPASKPAAKRQRQSRPRRTARPRKRDDAAAALAWYESAIAAGDDTSLLRAAGLLLNGARGVPRDPRRAVELLVRAAHVLQQPTLVAMAHVLRGGVADHGIEPQPERAHELFEAAAAQERTCEAIKGLADLAWSGRGCAMDRGRALELYERAADADPADVGARLGIVRCLWAADRASRDVRRARRIMRALIGECTRAASAAGHVRGADAAAAGLADAEVDEAIVAAVEAMGADE
nr:hypothetical protein HK105_003816 [Polyrhizophydium stewartii]